MSQYIEKTLKSLRESNSRLLLSEREQIERRIKVEEESKRLQSIIEELVKERETTREANMVIADTLGREVKWLRDLVEKLTIDPSVVRALTDKEVAFRTSERKRMHTEEAFRIKMRKLDKNATMLKDIIIAKNSDAGTTRDIGNSSIHG